MPVFTRIGYLIAGAISVAVFGSSVIGTNYSGVILNHLADVVHGPNTSVVVSTNAPNWGEGTPLPQVVGVTGATTTGTVASSTPIVFAIAALDGYGTTTLSTAVATTTDTNDLPNEGFQLSWGAVPGAMGYAIYFATSTSLTATLNQYFLASSTNGVPNTSYTFSTSTGSFTGSYTKLDTTAFSTLVNPSGVTFFNGGSVAIGTSTPQATLDIASGTIRAYAISTSTCSATTDGAILYNGKDKHLYVCEATVWQLIK